MGTICSPKRPAARGCGTRRGPCCNEIYTAWRWPRVVDKIEHRPLDYDKIWRMAQIKSRKPVRFGTCCSQVMGLFLDIDTPKYKDKREVFWDMAVAMNTELRRCATPAAAHPDRRATLPLHGQHVRQGPRGGKVHGRLLQPRGAGAGRCRSLDPHLLGQSQHAACHRRYELRGLVRAVSPSARAMSGRSRPRTAIFATSSCSHR